jgi:hypothetical protein
VNLSRRTFLKAGLVGAVALATAGWLKGPHAPPSGIPRRTLDADAEAILGAVVPVLLDGALPEARGAARRHRRNADRDRPRDRRGCRSLRKPSSRNCCAVGASSVRLGLARVASPWQRRRPQD